MFLPGTPCGCCGGDEEPPCQPCPHCAPLCLTATFSGFAHGTENCNECSFLDDVTFELKRPPDPTLSVTASVPSATGSGATFSLTTARSTTDGSYAVTGINLTSGGVNYSLGDKVTFSSNGCIAEQPEVTITIETAPPVATSLQMTASPASSWSPAIPVTYEQQAAEDGNPYWRVVGLGSPGFGLGFAEGQDVTLTSAETGVVVQEAAAARITQINRAAPTFGVRINRAGGGTFDGGFVVGRTQGTDANGREVWSVSSVGIGWWFPSDFTASDTVSFYMTGTTATTVRTATATIAVNESGAITSFTITDGGEYYDTNGRPTAVELLTAGRYYKPGVIKAVTLVSGGKIFGQNACEYRSDLVCAVCPAGGKLQMSLTLGATSHSMTVTLGQGAATILSGSRPSLDEEGNPISCVGMTFNAKHFSVQNSCMTNGTVTIAEGECGQSSQGGCPVPDQVSISASGIPLILGHSGAFGGGVSEAFVPGFASACGITGYCKASAATGGGLGNAANISLLSRDESGVIAEGGKGEDCTISYSGAMPDLPFGGADKGFNPFANCGGSLSGGRTATLSIGAKIAFTNVTISPPSWGSYGAKAEASVGGEQVTAITVTNPGEGYAREIFARTEPGMTVTLSGGTGSGATLTATLAQSGTGEEATWGVQSVAVTSGGTGYAENEAVVFTPEEGATTDYPASAYIVVGRVAPTVTASVSGGSGASLAVTLGQSTDWNGLDIWSVSSVTVNNGGTGYTDGANVTFTVTDGIEVYGASATISTVRGEPEVTASVPYSSGSGAVLTPSLSASGDSWTVSSIAITNGGTGYSPSDQVLISTDDIEAAGSYFFVSSVAENGAITGIGTWAGGLYYRDTGVISSVNFPSYGGGGAYYKSTGIIESVVVFEQGSYYLSESTGTSEVDTPVVTISSNAGEGAEAEATVDGDPESETFGQITGISVTSGGSGYLAAVPIWQATLNYDGLAHASVSERVTTDPCPTALLNRSYSMSLSVVSIPGLFSSGCGEPSAVIDNKNGTNTYSFDGITISVSAA